MQYVSVEFNESPGKVYAYQWGGEKALKMDDRVVVPANWANEYPSFARVVVVYSDREQCGYKGPLATIMGLVDERE